MCWRLRLSCRRRFILVLSYVCALCFQLLLWPACDDLESLEADEDLGPLPSNILDPPMWSHDQHAGGASCGSWQKPYTHMHRAVLAGELPPSYLIYTTGQGFPPAISGIPEAMKGIATVFMLALFTERAFVLDWKSPSGFNQIFVPRYINWRFDSLFKDDLNPILHVHDIGSKDWFLTQNKSVEFYTETDFNSYFSHEKEVIQSHSFDFTYALVRNRHFRHKVKELGLGRSKCRVCCIWNYLLKHSTSFQRNSASVAKKRLGLTPQNDLIFVDLSFPLNNFPRSLMRREIQQVFNCVQRVRSVLHEPVCVASSNNYILLEELHKLYPSAKTNNGLFFSKERYQLDLLRQINATRQARARDPSSTSTVIIPRTEHNALMYFFVGYYLQLNSTVLFTGKRSLYSESMAAFRHFYHPSDTYIVSSASECKLKRFIR